MLQLCADVDLMCDYGTAVFQCDTNQEAAIRLELRFRGITVTRPELLEYAYIGKIRTALQKSKCSKSSSRDDLPSFVEFEKADWFVNQYAHVI